MTLAPDHLGYHRPGEVDDRAETYHVLIGRVTDPTDPHPTPPAKHETDRACDVVIHHIAEHCHTADTLPRRRNPHMVLGLVLVDMGGPELYFPTLADLVSEWPMGGEFPTADAVDDYYYKVRTWLRTNGYGGTR